MPEILAPVGNFEMLKAAVVNGADAVYLGLGKFNARAKAADFGGDELKKAINYAHLFGVKVYAAINTVIKNSEMDEAVSAAIQAVDLGADALIVQDLGLAQNVRKFRPHAVLHASTQMGIHNAEGAFAAKRLGFSRVILSRETLLSDIVKIKKDVGIEVECFVQGALCIAFSGNCYFSSFASGYSGNRGKCMQLCRKKYIARSSEKEWDGYMLSAKDLMLKNRIDELIKAGVDCFKIEGRLRRPEYVAESVRIYKKAGKMTDDDLISLKKTFNRGDYTEGHMFVGTEKVLDTKLCGHKGAYFCKVLSAKGGTIKLEKPLCKGDGIKILENGCEVGSANITSDGNMTSYCGSARYGDDVYITTDAKANEKISARSRKLSVDVVVDFANGIATVSCDGIAVNERAEGEPAVNAPLSEADICSHFNRSEFFEVKNATLIGDPSFMRIGKLNELRRTLYDKLTGKILEKYAVDMGYFGGITQTMSDIISNKADFIEGDIYQVESPESVTDDMKFIAVNPKEYSVKEIMRFEKYFDRTLLNLPFVARGKDMDILKEIVSLPIKGVIANNLYGITLAGDKPVLLGYGMNILNDELDVPKIYSIESDKVFDRGYTYCKGNVPLMTFCHCERKELLGCGGCGGNGYDMSLFYENRRFALRHYKIHYCYAQLLNCADLDISKNVRKKFIDLSYERAGVVTRGNYGRGLK